MAELRGRVDIKTGRVTDLETGDVYSWAEWQARKQRNQLEYARSLNAMRNPASDLQNLWGRKPEFYDDWYGYFPPTEPPPPYADFDYP